MNNIPNFFFSSKIFNYVESLIDVGYLSFDDLPNLQKSHLIVKIIHFLGNDSYSLIVDPENSGETLNRFSHFLLSDNRDVAFYLAKKMKENAIQYYKDKINNIFEHILDNYSKKTLKDNRLIKEKDSKND